MRGTTPPENRWAVCLVVGVLMSLTGCGMQIGSAGKGPLKITSRDHGGWDLGSIFGTGYYAVDDRNTVTLVLLAGTETDPQAAMTVRVFWKPAAGSTPVGKTATNATVQLLVFGDSPLAPEPIGQTDQVGLYAGAGFVYLNNDPGAKKLRAGLWEANLHLADRSQDFIDLLGPAILSGAMVAQRDDVKVNQLLDRLGQLTSQRLGYPRLVYAQTPPNPTPDGDGS